MSGNHNANVNRPGNVRVFEVEPFTSEPEPEFNTDRPKNQPKIEEPPDTPEPETQPKENKPDNKVEQSKSAKQRKKEDAAAAAAAKKAQVKQEQPRPKAPTQTKKPTKMKKEEPMKKATESSVPPKRTVTIKENNDRNARKTESCVDKLQSASRLWKIGLCLFLLGFLFDIMSFVTPNWMVIPVTGSDDITVGLWCACTSISNCTFRASPAGCLNTLRGFHGVSVLLCILICILLVVYLNKSRNKRSLGLTIIIITGVAALSTQICTGVFGQNYGCMDDVTSAMTGKWGWSMALAFVSIVCLSVAAVLFYVHELRGCNGGKSKWRAWLAPDIRVT